MEANVYWTANVGTFPDENGIAWGSAAGPTGSVAVGGGGYASINADGMEDIPFLPIVASKPDPSATPNGWMFGVLSPPGVGGTGAIPGVRVHCFVVCLEDMP